MFTPSPVKFNRIDALITSHIKSIKEDGLKGLLDAIKDISVKSRRALISKDTYFLYEKNLMTEGDLKIVPSKITDVKMEIVFLPISIEEYEVLGEKSYDFRKHPKVEPFSFIRGDGTIIFLGIKDDNIIYRSCISNYRNGVYSHIYPIKLGSKTTCYQGFNWTHPMYRKKGLYQWAQTVMFNFMKENGFKKIIMLEPEDQIGPRKVQERLGSKMLCESFAFRLLFLVNYRWNRPGL